MELRFLDRHPDAEHSGYEDLVLYEHSEKGIRIVPPEEIGKPTEYMCFRWYDTPGLIGFLYEEF